MTLASRFKKIIMMMVMMDKVGEEGSLEAVFNDSKNLMSIITSILLTSKRLHRLAIFLCS